MLEGGLDAGGDFSVADRGTATATLAQAGGAGNALAVAGPAAQAGAAGGRQSGQKGENERTFVHVAVSMGWKTPGKSWGATAGSFPFPARPGK